MNRPVSEEVRHLFAERGELKYGEDVTQLEHALQCAYLAREEGASDELIVAALLHDIGHLLYGTDNAAEHGEDDAHERLGERWLRDYYGPEVTEPIRLHVAAKRYLCATNPDYLENLSAASRKSLELQGGPMNAEEVAEFESNPWFKEAIRLRAWDDEGKKMVEVPTLETYFPLVDNLVKASANRSFAI